MRSGEWVEVCALLAAGARVELHGLASRPELNGCGARLTECAGSRCGALLDGHKQPISLKPENLQIALPEAYVVLAPGTLVELQGLKGRPELNGLLACVVSRAGERWAVLADGHDAQVSLKAEAMRRVLRSSPPPVSSWEENIHDVLALANLLVHDLVEGPQSYPVIRRLQKVQACSSTEELVPEGRSGSPQQPCTWSDLPSSESQRLFYKMSLSGRCSELVYAFADLVNGMSGRSSPAFRGSTLPGMFICVGWVTHEYRRLALVGDFGQTYWQHSVKVNNRARNHVWLEFPLLGAEPGDQGRRMILDLAAAQFDMRAPGSLAHVVRGQDQRYRKCYELPCTHAPIHFLSWSASQNNVNFEAQHCMETTARFREMHKLPRPATSCADVHAALGSILRKSGTLIPGMLLQLASRAPEVRALEEACGITLTSIQGMEQNAVQAMMGQTDGHGRVAAAQRC